MTISTNSARSLFGLPDIFITANMPSSRDEIRLSPTSNRKFNKPLMEKRRRARINDSLGQLKTLVLQAMKKDSTQYSKLEKADILEMTLKYLRNVQRQEVNATLDTTPQMIGKYKSGFNECASEVARYFNSMPGMQTETKTRVLNHLANCVNNIPSYPDELHATQTLPGARQPLHVQVNAMRNYPQMNYYSGGPMQLAPHEHQSGARCTRGLSASPTASMESQRAFMNYRSPSPSSTIGQNDSFMDILSIKSESPRSSPSCSNVSVDSPNWSSDLATIKGEIISQGPIGPPEDDKVWRPW